jgi:hypothetical protein
MKFDQPRIGRADRLFLALKSMTTQYSQSRPVQKGTSKMALKKVAHLSKVESCTREEE